MSDWRNGFCDCCGSMSDCCIGYFCPCIHAALAAKSAEQGTLMAGLQCFFYPCLVPLMRYQAREKRGIDGNIVTDVLAGWCLPCCTTIQVKREFDS